MSLFAVFDPAMGRILRSGQCQESDIDLQSRAGEEVVELANADLNDANAYVLAGVVTARPAMPATIDGLTISNIPAGTVLTIEGVDYVIEDGEAELTFSAAGTYQVKLVHWPHYDQTFEVVAP